MAKYTKDMIQACADWVRENGLIDFGMANLTDICNTSFREFGAPGKPDALSFSDIHRTGNPVFMTFSPDSLLDINHIQPDLQIPVHYDQPPAKVHV